MTSEHYNVNNIQTGYYVFSDGTETVGTRVFSVSPGKNEAKTIIITISPPVAAVNPKSTIQGKAGLYAAPAKVESGQHIVWHKEPYYWEIAHTTSSQYEIFVPGSVDLYWYDEFGQGIGPGFILKHGSEIKEKENVFYIVKA